MIPSHLSPSERRRSRKFFTLLELIVVIVILGILALLAIPTFAGTIHKSEQAVLTQNAEATYRNAQAEAALGIQAAGPVSQSLTLAAANFMVRASKPGSPGKIQPPSNGAVIWAQNGGATTPGYIESYDSAWQMCVQLTVPPLGTPTVGTCNTADPGSLSLMAVVDPSNVGTIDGTVAPWVPDASSYSFGGGGPQASPYADLAPGAPVPTQVTVATPTASVVVASPGATADPGSNSITVSTNGSSVNLSWSLSQATAAGSYNIYRCSSPGCTPSLSGVLASTAGSSYSDTTVAQGTTYYYQVGVLDSAGNTLLSNIASVTVPKGALLAIAAGNGTEGAPTPGPATSSALGYSNGIATDASGNIYIADYTNCEIEKVTPAGQLSVIAGTGICGTATSGPATSAAIGVPDGIAANGSGDVFFSQSNQIVEITPAGQLSIFAGTGSSGAPTPGPATSSNLHSPQGLAVDSQGNLYIADYGNNVIEKVTPAGQLSVIAGTGTIGSPTAGPATSSNLDNPADVAVDSAGDVYAGTYVQVGNGGEEIVKITPAGQLSIFAGGGSGFAPGPATGVGLSAYDGPSIATDANGNVYIPVITHNVIAKITPDGNLSILAGNGTSANPVPGLALSSPLNSPARVAAAGSTVYASNTSTYQILKISQ